MRLPAILSALVLGASVSAAHAAAEPIWIKYVNSYSGQPALIVPYRNGANLAVEEINAAGVVLGRPLELLSRDDNGKPEGALRVANELVFNSKVVALTGIANCALNTRSTRARVSCRLGNSL